MKQAHCLTRQEFYDLVWSTPKKTLAATFGVSDVALGKACRKANIPVPDRGYWAKKQAGRAPVQPKLPPRFPGASDWVRIGGNHWDSYWSLASATDPLPPVPTFPEELETARTRIVAMVRRVSCPRLGADTAHPLVRKILLQDEERAKAYAKSPYSWNAPLYATPTDRRRLRIVNALFLGLQRLGCRPSMTTSREREDTREPSIEVGDEHVQVRLAEVVVKGRKRNEKAPAKPRLRLELTSVPRDGETTSVWEDAEDRRIEERLTDIVVEVLFAGELQYRSGERQRYAWLVEHKARLEEEERQRVLEAERKARELEERRQRARIARLLSEAAALQRATTIRNYVAAIQAQSDAIEVAPEVLEGWSAWALAQADRIDPVRNPVSLRGFQDGESSDL